MPPLTPIHEKKKAALRADIERGIRAKKELEIMEQYEAIIGGSDCQEPLNGVKTTDFKQLTKGDAAAVILEEANRSMKVRLIFEEMKKREHPVQDVDALRTLLEKDKRFMKTGPGEYDLDPLY